MWDNEMKALIMLTAFGKTEELKGFVSQIPRIDEQIVSGCLKMYLNACKRRHSVAFFQWREHHARASEYSGSLGDALRARMKQLDQAHKEKKLLHQRKAEEGDGTLKRILHDTAAI